MASLRAEVRPTTEPSGNWIAKATKPYCTVSIPPMAAFPWLELFGTVPATSTVQRITAALLGKESFGNCQSAVYSPCCTVSVVRLMDAIPSEDLFGTA